MRLRLTTARKLVESYHRGNRVTTKTLNWAIRQVQEAGWLVNFVPPSGQYDRTFVLVAQDSFLAPVLRFVNRRPTYVPKGLVEGCFQSSLTEVQVGQQLGLHGLAMTGNTQATVQLTPTSPVLAQMVNMTRYVAHPYGRFVELVISAALDLKVPMQRIRPEARLRAAEIFEAMQVDASELLCFQKRARLLSPWQLAEIEEFSPPF